MSLLAIKDHLIQVKSASLANLAAYFHQADLDVLRDMLAHWMRKGKVRCFAKTALCGQKCTQCPVEQTEIYQWV
jgi:putative ferrous iron transport protein C